MKQTGYIMYFDDLRGDGLVKSYSGLILFLHYSSLPGYSRHSHVSAKNLAPIKFDIVDGFAGPQAHNVEYIEDKSRINVCEDAIIKILEQDDDDLRFGKDWRLNSWLDSLRIVAKKDGYFISDATEPFWNYNIG